MSTTSTQTTQVSNTQKVTVQPLSFTSQVQNKQNDKQGQNQQIQEESSSSSILIASPLIDTCRYCKKQFSEDDVGSVRFQCSQCKDFVLCIDCFLAQISYKSHKPTHKFYIMHSDLDNYYPHNDGFSLYDDLLLLEGIKALGFGSWSKICSFMARQQEQSVLLCKHYFMCLNNEMENLNTSYNNSQIPNIRNKQWTNQQRFTTQVQDFIDKYKIKKSAELLKLTKESLHISAMPSLTRFPPSYSFGQLPARTGFRSGYMPFRMQVETEYINRAEYSPSYIKITFKETYEQFKIKILMLRVYAQRLARREKQKQLYWSEYQNYTFKEKRWVNTQNFIYYNSLGRAEFKFKDKYKRDYTDEEKHDRLLDDINDEKISQAEQELTYTLRTLQTRPEIRQYCSNILLEQYLRKEIFTLQIAQILGYKWYDNQVIKEVQLFMTNQRFSNLIFRNYLPQQIFSDINQVYKDIRMQLQGQTLEEYVQQMKDYGEITEQQEQCLNQLLQYQNDKNISSLNYLVEQITRYKTQFKDNTILTFDDLSPIIFFVYQFALDQQQQVQSLNYYSTSLAGEMIFVQLSLINLPIAMAYGLQYVFAYNLYILQKRISYNINNIPFSIKLLNQVFQEKLQQQIQQHQLTEKYTNQYTLQYFYNQLFQHATDYVSHQEVNQLELRTFSNYFVQSDFYQQNQINSQLFYSPSNWKEYSQQFMINNSYNEKVFNQIYTEEILFDHSIQPAKLLTHLCYILNKHSLQYVQKDIIYELIQSYGINHKLSNFIVESCQQYQNINHIEFNQNKKQLVRSLIKASDTVQKYVVTSKQTVLNTELIDEQDIFDNFNVQQKLAVNFLDKILDDNQLFMQQQQKQQQQEQVVLANEINDVPFSQIRQIRLDELNQETGDMLLDILDTITQTLLQYCKIKEDEELNDQFYGTILDDSFQNLDIKIQNDQNIKQLLQKYQVVRLQDIISKKHQLNTLDYIIDLQLQDEMYQIDQQFIEALTLFYRQNCKSIYRDKIPFYQFIISLQEQLFCSLFKLSPVIYGKVKATLMINNLTTTIEMLSAVDNRPSIIDFIKIMIVKQYKQNSKCVLQMQQLQKCIQQFRTTKNTLNYKNYNLLVMQKDNIYKDQQDEQYSIKVNFQFTYMDKPMFRKQKFYVQTNQPHFETHNYDFRISKEVQWKQMGCISLQHNYLLLNTRLLNLLSHLSIFIYDKPSLQKLAQQYEQRYDDQKIKYDQQQQLLQQRQQIQRKQNVTRNENIVPYRVAQRIRQQEPFTKEDIKYLNDSDIKFLFKYMCDIKGKKPLWVRYVTENNEVVRELVKEQQRIQYNSQ